MTAPNQTAIVLYVMKALRPMVVGAARSNFDNPADARAVRGEGGHWLHIRFSRGDTYGFQ